MNSLFWFLGIPCLQPILEEPVDVISFDIPIFRGLLFGINKFLFRLIRSDQLLFVQNYFPLT